MIADFIEIFSVCPFNKSGMKDKNSKIFVGKETKKIQFIGH
jgi:hypothetical protein